IAGIDNGPALHGIDALELEEKITSLRDLKSRFQKAIFLFPAEFAGATNNLACHQERDQRLAQSLPLQTAGQQIVVMATVAMAAKISVVLVKPDGVVRALIQIPGAVHQELVSGVVLLQMFQERTAFGRAIFRVGMVVVKTGAVAQNQITPNGSG